MLLVVLVVVMALYINQAVTYFSVRSEAEQQMAAALSLERQNRVLAAGAAVPAAAGRRSSGMPGHSG